MRNKLYSITIGIPTYVGSYSLVKTVDSIRTSNRVKNMKIIVTVDGNPLKPKVKNALRVRGVQIIENKVRGGQVKRIKQLISMTQTDLLVLAQDDVIFDPDCLYHLQKYFRLNSQATMVGARIFPAKARTFFERIVETGVLLTHTIGEDWKNGDNYLLSSGRCLAFRTKFIKSFTIPDSIVNSDSYLYFENKRKGGRFIGLKRAIVYNKSPQNLAENSKQSKRFQLSQVENEVYSKTNLSHEYNVPFMVKVQSVVKLFFRNPLYTSLYLLLFLHTRYVGIHTNFSGRFWDTDKSTKKI